jgi:hypothetical protein
MIERATRTKQGVDVFADLGFTPAEAGLRVDLKVKRAA